MTQDSELSVLSKREAIAALALAGALANPTDLVEGPARLPVEKSAAKLAILAVQHADALLVELAKAEGRS